MRTKNTIFSLTNTSGKIQKRIRLGRRVELATFTFNSYDDCWYLSISNLCDGIRILPNRVLFANFDGFIIAPQMTTKEGFSAIEIREYLRR